MSAYVVVELTVKNAEAKDRYSAAAGPVLKDHGGEFIAGGASTVLTGEPGFTNGAIIRFADRRPGSRNEARLANAGGRTTGAGGLAPSLSPFSSVGGVPESRRWFM